MVPVPTPRLAVLALAGAFAILVLPGWGMAAVDILLVLIALADAALAVDPSKIEVSREMPAAVTIAAGGADVRWRVHNQSDRRVHVAVADELAPSLHPAARRTRVAIPASGTVTVATRIDPVRRGRFEVSEVVVRVDGPLHLASRQRRRAVPATLRVLPAFRSRKDAELWIERARLLDVGLRVVRAKGGGTEFDSLRDYTVDDEFRRIDWAATARAGRPIVRTYRAERNQQVIVLLDAGRMMAGQVAGVPRLEWGMDAAMVLTAVATRLGDRCGLVTFERDVRAVVPPRTGSHQLTRVIEAMYDLEPQLVESDYRGAFAATVGRFRRRSMLVLVTELAEEAVSETLIPALPLLLSRHLVVVASVTDPDVVDWAGAVPTEPSSTFRAAAAVEALERRAATAARLRGVGATVVDAPPGKLAPALADTYLSVKAAGRL